MKIFNTQRTDSLEAMFKQVRDLDLGLLLTGLTILVKDTAVYLTTQGIDDEMTEGFRFAYLNMLSDNRYYRERFGPKLYLTLKDAKLPEGFANGAANCESDILRPLTNLELETEWLRAPGWHFFQTYMGQRKNDILCDITIDELRAAFNEGKDPYDNEDKDSCLCENEDSYIPIEWIVNRLTGTGREFNAFWYPVMLYLALLLHKTNFTLLEDQTVTFQ